MKVIKKEEFLADLDNNVENMSYGAVFIYPTDTLYGLGCDARNNALVQRVKRIKNIRDQPMSVIVPSKDWIKQNLDYQVRHKHWLSKLPGPYTLIMKRTVPDCVADDVNPVNDTLGVRIPDNWFADIVSKLNFPVVSTSLNMHGQNPYTSLKDIPEYIKSMVDFAIDDGTKKGKEAELVDLTGPKAKVLSKNVK